MRTIHSSKFSTENCLRPDLFTSLDVAGAQCDSRIALEIAKSGAPAAKTAGTAAGAGAAVATRTEKWWSELDDAG